MAKKVASLYAEIGADTSGLKRGLDDTKKGLDKTQKSLGNFKSAAGIAAAAIVGVGVAAKKAWDFAKEGAALELTATQFRNVAENAGYTADVLLKQMRQATNGLVSDAELMASGLDIIQLGLADSQQGVVDLATVVSTLGLDMQQVILTFANNSIMRLDALGLSVQEVQARAKELQEQGFVGDAFDQAVLEGLQQRMAVLGDTAETTAGQMQKLEVAWENLKNKAAASWSEGIAPYVIGLNDAIEYQDLLNLAVESGALLQDDTRDVYERVTNGIWTQSEAVEFLTRVIGDHAAAQQADTTTMIHGEGVVWSYATAAQEAAAQSAFYGAVIRDNQAAQSLLNETLTAGGKAYSDISTNVYSLTQSLQDQLDFLTAGGGALLDLAQTAQQALDEGNFAGAQEALTAAAEGAVDLDLELGKIDPDEAVQRLMDLGNGPEEAKAKLAEFQSSLFALTSANHVVYIDLVTRGQVPRSGTGTAPGFPEVGPGGSYASGTDGWMKVPGPVGAPYPITLHGGEPFNVLPAGQSPGGMGGGGVNIYGDIIVQDGSGVLELFTELAQRGARSQAAARGGVAYSGRM